MADTDILTLAEGRAAVNLPDASEPNDLDIEVQGMITGITGRIDALCGPVVQRTVEDEAHDGGRDRVLLRKQHVAELTDVVEWSFGSATTHAVLTLANTGSGCRLYHGNQDVYAWVLRLSGARSLAFAGGVGNVLVSYTAGRFATTAEVDERFKQTAAAVLRRLWKREQSTWSQSPDFFAEVDNPAPAVGFFKAVDPMVCELLGDQLLPPVGMY